MTQQTENLPTAALTTAGEKLARLGLACPWVGDDAWCDLGGLVMGDDFMSCHCPPAVAAAVVAFAGELEAWCDEKKWFRCEVRHEGKWIAEAMKHKRLLKSDWAVSDDFDTQLAAAAALIIAVAEALEGE